MNAETTDENFDHRTAAEVYEDCALRVKLAMALAKKDDTPNRVLFNLLQVFTYRAAVEAEAAKEVLTTDQETMP